MTGSDALLATTDYPPSRYRVKPRNDQVAPAVALAMRRSSRASHRRHHLLDSSLDAVDASLVLGVLVGLTFAVSGLYRLGQAIRESPRAC